VQRTEEVLFGLKVKRVGKTIVSMVWIHPYEHINGWREIANRKIVENSAWIQSLMAQLLPLMAQLHASSTLNGSATPLAGAMRS
jgi:hypothetical protein